MADGSVVILIEGDDSKFKSTLGKLGDVAKTGMKAVGAAIGSVTASLGVLAGYAVKVGSDFEAGMSNVAAISGATGDEIQALTDKAKEMGAKTKFSATESADALSYMAMAGWKTEDMLGGLEGVMNLAAASGEDLAATSDIVTDALTAFGMRADESGRFADVLAAASSNSNTNVGLMGETFQYVAPVAGALGYAVEDAAVAIGLMANAGIKGSQAGTALRAMLTNLAKPSKQVAGYMDELGLSLTDAAGNVKPMSDLLLDLREKFAGLTEAQKAEYAAGIAGQEGMSGLLSIVNASEADFQKLTAAIQNSNGAAEEMAGVMNDNLQGAATIAKSGIEGLGISIYESLEGPLKTGVQSATGAIQKLQSSLNSGQMKTAAQTLAKGLGDIVSGLAKFASNAVPKAISAVAALVQNTDKIAVAIKAVVAAFAAFKAASWSKTVMTSFQAASQAIQAHAAANRLALVAMNGALTAQQLAVGVLTGKMSLLTAAQGALRAVMSANPFVLAAVGVGVAVTAIGAYQLATRDAAAESENLNTRIRGVKDAMEEQAEAQGTLASARADSISGILTEVGAVEGYVSELNRITDENGRVNQGYERRAEYLADQINSLIPGAVSANEDEAGAIYSVSEAIDDKIFALKKEMSLEAMREEYMDALEQQKVAEKTVTDALKTQGVAQEELAEAQRKRYEAINPREEERYALEVANAEAKLRDATDAVNTAKAAAEGYQQTLNTFNATVAAQSLEELDAVLAGVSDNVVKNTGANQAELAKAVADMQLTYSRLVAEAASAWDTMNADEREAWTTRLQTMKSSLDQQVAEASSGGLAIVQNLADGAAAGSYLYPEEIQALLEDGAAECEAAGVQLYGVGEEHDARLASGVRANAGEVNTAVVGVVSGAADAAHSASSQFETIGKYMMDGLAAGIGNNSGDPIGMAAWVAAQAASAAKKAADEHSPSKVFMKIGRYMSEGLALGIRQGKQMVLDAQEEVCDALTRVARSGIGALNDAITKIQSAAQERQAEKELADHEKSIRDKYKAIEKLEREHQEKLAKAKQSETAKLEEEYLEDREKLLADISKLDAEWEETQRKAREQAQQEALKASISSLEKLQSEYEKARGDVLQDMSSLAGKLAEYGDLFTIDSKSGALTLTNWKKNLEAVQQYGEALQNLKDKGASRDFLAQVSGLGVEEGLQFAEQLASLGDAQLAEYLDTWEAVQSTSKEVAEEFYADQLSALDEEFSGKLDARLVTVPVTMSNVGKDAMQGMIDGMQSKAGALARVAGAIVRQAINAMKLAADIHSPSKKTRDLIGKPMGEGVGVGFERALPLAMEKIRAAVELETGRLSMTAAARVNTDAVSRTVPEVRTYYQKEREESTPNIIFSGELAALGRLLRPYIEMEKKRKGGNFVKGGTV